MPVEGNYYKVDAGSETAYTGNETVELTAQDTAIQTGYVSVKVDSEPAEYVLIGDPVEDITGEAPARDRTRRRCLL